MLGRARRWIAGLTPPAGAMQVDPLRNSVAAGCVTVLVFVTAATSLILSVEAGHPQRLPAVALSSPAIFHVLRMVVPTAVVALLSVFLVRAAFGYFPHKVSTTSAEWPAAAAVAERDAATATNATKLATVVQGL